MAINAGHPCTITLMSEEILTIKGISYMPGQLHREHIGDIKDFEIDAFIGDKFITIYRETASTSFDLKKFTFAMPVKTDKLRLRVLSGFGKSRYYEWNESKEGWSFKKIDYKDESVTIGALSLDIQDDDWQDMTSNEIIYKEVKTITVEIDD